MRLPPSIHGAGNKRSCAGRGRGPDQRQGHLHGMGLLDSKTRSVVGLDIEPGFLAAAEFTGGGKPSLVRAATETPRPRPLPRGRGRRRRRARRPREGLLQGARPAQAHPARRRQPEDRAPRARAAGDRQRAGARGRDSLPGAGGASDAARAGGARLPRAGACRQRRGRPDARRRRGRPPRHRRAPARGGPQGRAAARAGRPLRVRDDPRAVRAARDRRRRSLPPPTSPACPSWADDGAAARDAAGRGAESSHAPSRRPSPRRSTATSAASPTLRSASARTASSTASCRTASSRWRPRSPSAAA